jgi:ketosteroid isomerase-like protein
MKSARALGIIVLVASCASSQDEAADRAAIDSLRTEHVAAVNSRNADLLLNGEADDLVYLAPDLAPILGRQALDALLGPLYQQLAPHITMTPRQVVLRGDLAVEWGCLGGHIEQLSGGDPIPNDGKYVIAYQRLPNVGWKITHSITNRGPCLNESAPR